MARKSNSVPNGFSGVHKRRAGQVNRREYIYASIPFIMMCVVAITLVLGSVGTPNYESAIWKENHFRSLDLLATYDPETNTIDFSERIVLSLDKAHIDEFKRPISTQVKASDKRFTRNIEILSVNYRDLSSVGEKAAELPKSDFNLDHKIIPGIGIVRVRTGSKLRRGLHEFTLQYRVANAFSQVNEKEREFVWQLNDPRLTEGIAIDELNVRFFKKPSPSNNSVAPPVGTAHVQLNDDWGKAFDYELWRFPSELNSDEDGEPFYSLHHLSQSVPKRAGMLIYLKESA